MSSWEQIDLWQNLEIFHQIFEEAYDHETSSGTWHYRTMTVMSGVSRPDTYQPHHWSSPHFCCITNIISCTELNEIIQCHFEYEFGIKTHDIPTHWRLCCSILNQILNSTTRFSTSTTVKASSTNFCVWNNQNQKITWI